MPWGTYGGPLVAGEPGDAPDALGTHLRHSLGLGWFLATPGPWQHVPLGSPFATYSTQVVDLSGGLDGLWKGLDKDARNQVRQAERAGVEVSVDNSLSAFDDYYAMLEASAQRWGRTDPGKPRSLFRAIARLGTEATTRLWLGLAMGCPIDFPGLGVLVVLAGVIVLPPLGYLLWFTQSDQPTARQTISP